MQVGSQYVYCTYNDEGYRATKTYQNKVTTYYLDDSRITAEETNGNVTVYLYDVSGAPIGMQYHASSYAEDDWDIFWYEKNLQGDIVAVYSEAGTKLVSYTYDAWGNFNSTYHNGSSSSTIIGKNPFLYRGYYYDRDLKLYYLNARYYDPAVGRFINADEQISGIGGDVLGYNLYVYAFNNPIMLSDNTGEWPSWATKTLVAVGIAAIAVGISIATAGTGTAVAVVAAGAAKGAVAGMMSGALTGAAIGAVSHRASYGTWDGFGDTALNGMADGALSGAISGAVLGGVFSGVGYRANSNNQIKDALNTLNSSGIRPGQTQISKSRVMELVNNFDSTVAQSSIYKNGSTLYIVDGHHTTVASTILGKGTCINMGVATNQLPSATNVYWSRKWYEFGKTVIKIVD